MPRSKLLVGAPESTYARSTHVVALFVATLRLGTLVQMTPSFLVAVDVSPRPGLCVASWLVAISASAGTAGFCIIRRRAPGGTWAVVDVTVGATLLLIGTATVPSEFWLGSWVGFQPAYALSVAFALVGLRGLLAWVAGVGTLAVAQLAYLMPLFGSHSVDVASAIGSMLSLLVLSALNRLGAGALLRLARSADENKVRAVAAGREAEAYQGRVAVHNAATMIRLLLDLDRPVSAAGHAARASLLLQASDELSRMRAYLRGTHREPGDDGHGFCGSDTLVTVVEGVAREFGDLDVLVQTELAPVVPVSSVVRADLAAALRSLLLNVRQHARASQVVLYAEATDRYGGWRLTVHDDGTGFDVASVSWGAGLADVVVGQLDLHDIEVVVDSLPGVGTTVTLRWMARDDAARPATHA